MTSSEPQLGWKAEAVLGSLGFLWRTASAVGISTGIYYTLHKGIGMDEPTAMLGTLSAMLATSIYLLMKLRDHHAEFFNKKMDEFKEEWLRETYRDRELR